MPGLLGCWTKVEESSSPILLAAVAGAMQHHQGLRTETTLYPGFGAGRVHLGYLQPEAQPARDGTGRYSLWLGGESTNASNPIRQDLYVAIVEQKRRYFWRWKIRAPNLLTKRDRCGVLSERMALKGCTKRSRKARTRAPAWICHQLACQRGARYNHILSIDMIKKWRILRSDQEQREAVKGIHHMSGLTQMM
jgi:hypothetical protein